MASPSPLALGLLAMISGAAAFGPAAPPYISRTPCKVVGGAPASRDLGQLGNEATAAFLASLNKRAPKKGLFAPTTADDEFFAAETCIPHVADPDDPDDENFGFKFTCNATTNAVDLKRWTAIDCAGAPAGFPGAGSQSISFPEGKCLATGNGPDGPDGDDGVVWACKKLQWGANQAGLFQYVTGAKADEMDQCQTNKPAQNVMIRTYGCNPKFRADPEDPHDVKYPFYKLSCDVPSTGGNGVMTFVECAEGCAMCDDNNVIHVTNNKCTDAVKAVPDWDLPSGVVTVHGCQGKTLH